MRIRWVLVAAVAFSWGCTCQGTPQPRSVSKPALVEDADADTDADPEPAKQASKSAAKGRFEREREGFVKATLGDKTLDFRILPPKTNRVAIVAKPSLLVVDAVPTEGSPEHLQVRMYGVSFADSKGRAVTGHRGEGQFSATVAYIDPGGKAFVGKLRAGLEIELGTVHEGSQTVEGTFSGKLSERKGDGVLEVTNGAFKTSLVGAAPSAADAPP